MTADPCLWMTSCVDHCEHAIDEMETRAGRREGHYHAVCGHDVYPVAMTAPTGRRCPLCDHETQPPPPPKLVARILSAIN